MARPLASWAALMILAAVGSDLARLSAQDAKKKADPIFWWRDSYKAAKAEAAARNVPIILVIIQDQEESNDVFVLDIMATKEFLRLTERCVAVIAAREEHETAKFEIDGQSQDLCKKFKTVSCTEHKKLEREMYVELFDGAPVKTPHLKVILPDGKVEASFEDHINVGAFNAAFKAAAAKLGPGVERAAWVTIKKEIAEAREAQRTGDLAKAWELCEDIVAKGAQSKIAKDAALMKDEIQKSLDVLVGEVENAAKAEDYATAFAKLDELKAGAKGTPIAPKVAPIEKKLSAAPGAKDVLAGRAREKRYEKNWTNAEALLKKGDNPKAIKEYRTIAQALGDLPLGKKAKQRLESLGVPFVPEPEAASQPSTK